MNSINNALQQLSDLDFETLDDFLNEISDNLSVAVAIFDMNDTIKGISAEMSRCKCYYMLLHNRPNQCAMFEPSFIGSVLSKNTDKDILCNYGCRQTLRIMELFGSLHKVVIFQYNLLNDNLDFNPHDSPNYIPLYRGTNSATVDYF